MQATKFKVIIFLLTFSLFSSVVRSYGAQNKCEQAIKTESTSQDTTAKVNSAGTQETDSVAIDSLKLEKRWKLNNTYIGGSVSWKNQEGNKESDYEFRVGSSITGRLDRIDLKLESLYKSKKGSPNDNEQYARANWYHDFFRRFYVMGQVQLERDQISYEGTRFDYILLQEGAGPGYRLKIEKLGESRLSVLYNFLHVSFFDQNVKGNYQVVSIYLDNSYNLTKKINLSNWTNIIFWSKNEVGFDIETELMYKLTKSLGIGLRHIYFLNGPTLQKQKSSDFKIYIKITV
jgi:hypothetical protein